MATTTTKPRKPRNTFTKFAGSTFKCDVCGRLTRYTGEQGMGSALCPHCWNLAGLDNEISDGAATAAENAPAVRRLVAELVAKGGSLKHWASLLAEVGWTAADTERLHTSAPTA